MGDEIKVVSGHVGYSPDYKAGEPPRVNADPIVRDFVRVANRYEDGVKAERARIVAALREAGPGLGWQTAWGEAANWIEKGGV